MLREAAFAAKVIATANKVWGCTDVIKRVDKGHVNVTYNKNKGMMTAKVKCLLCTESVSMNATKYDATSMGNYKRHVTTKHLKRIDKNQPTLENILSKRPPTAVDDEPQNEQEPSESDTIGSEGES